MGKITITPITTKSIQEANARGKAIIDSPTAVMDARITVLANDLFLSLIFRDGSRVAIPTTRIAEFHGLDANDLADIQVNGFHDSISVLKSDIDIYIPGLLTDLFGRVVAAETGRTGGKSKSNAKAAAVRENGRKGGRPRKKNNL